LQSVKIIISDVFATQQIDFCRATAIVGSHGAGKSVLLRMIEAAFGHTSPFQLPPFPGGGRYVGSKIHRLGGVIEVALRTPDGIISRTVDLSQSPEQRAGVWEPDINEPFAAYYVDAFSALDSLSYIIDAYDFDSPLRDVDTAKALKDFERNLSKAELGAIRNILGRAYDRIAVRSVFMGGDANDYFYVPFISASLGPEDFNNTSMSQGELWVHYVSWFLEHEVGEKRLALLDEPEAFLAARGQRPFIDHIAHQVLRQDLQLIVGTHSSEILSRFPLNNIRMCVSDGSRIQVTTPESRFQIRECIGLETPVRGIILVEDELAERLIAGIFARYDTALTCEIETVSVGGASEVITGLRILQTMGRLTCLGVLDGDQRKMTARQVNVVQSALLYLPGHKSPEQELLSSALNEPRKVAEITNATSDKVVMAINSCRDLDHQYQIEKVARQLGLSKVTLTDLLVQVWLLQPEIAREAEQLSATIRGKLRETNPGAS
jgi:energy-coupling factor transporter ATP-binding protein EcfA2